MSEEKNNQLIKEIQIMNNLLAYSICKDMTVTDAAPLLSRLGMEPKEIAIVMDSTSNAVSARISESKK